MADTINGTSFVGVLGNIALPRATARPITDPNEDYDALMEMGIHTPITQLRAYQGYTNAAAGAAALATYQGWINSAVTIVQNGVSYANRIILDVERDPGPEVTSPTYSGGNGPHWMEFIFTIQYGGSS